MASAIRLITFPGAPNLPILLRNGTVYSSDTALKSICLQRPVLYTSSNNSPRVLSTLWVQRSTMWLHTERTRGRSELRPTARCLVLWGHPRLSFRWCRPMLTLRSRH